MPLKLKQFLNELLEVMEEDYQQQLQEIIKDARGITCLQTLDNEKAVIQIDRRRIKISSKAPKKQINVHITLSRNCLFEILEGRITLEQAFYSKELEVLGDPATLLRCYRIWERIMSLARTSARITFLTYRLR
ncbi:MAG: SCP2 sterol-binding domain-containing protein [Thaumarchaeota archaeon]|nr:SCP2 sterol-binding domain-containing protein [Nitrososphaerota archaeon]MCL5317967.1 SCP2 sterol-binding domain-containing protein [Nitrososphaerota archaeon]